MLKPAFIDLSHWNTVPQSLEAAKASGILGVIHKATEGTTVDDDKLEARYALARDAGMLWGVYHFIRPGVVEDQVDYFLDMVSDVIDGQTLFALDWEDNRVSLLQAIGFMQRIEQITNHSPVLYSGHVLKEALDGHPCEPLSRYRLWLAQYASKPELPPGWTSYWAWQYTDKGEVPGVNPPTDLNAFDGTAEELRRSWSGAEAPAPAPAQIEITVIVPRGVKVDVQVR